MAYKYNWWYYLNKDALLSDHSLKTDVKNIVQKLSDEKEDEKWSLTSKTNKTISELKKWKWYEEVLKDHNKSLEDIEVKYKKLQEKEIDKFLSWFEKIDDKEFYSQCTVQEDQKEKSQDLSEAQEVIFKGQFLVNITTKGKKKIATIHDAKTTSLESIELDEERGDKFFDTIEEAQKYADSINSKK
jgi:hypothetical protein